MMIQIKIDEPLKLKNNILVKMSAFVSFDYDADVVSYIKQMSTRIYNSETHTWEMPVQNIIGLCNKFTNHDIQISGMYKDLSDKVGTEIPLGYVFKTKPFSHQLDGVRFGLAKKKFLLCDDQGLGKTKQIIDWVGCLNVTDKINKVLIVCGVNSLKYNWQSEIGIHSNESGWVLGTRFRKTTGKAYEGSTQDKLYDLNNLPNCKFIITNIETLRAGSQKVGKKYIFPIAEKIRELCDAGIISVIAFDECHKSKEPTSLQSRAMSLINAPYMCAMSGTPLMNNPLDLYFPLHWLGYEEHSFYKFKQHYCNLGGWGGTQVVGYKNLDEIRAKMDMVMLRRLKMEVLDLPDKIRQTEFVDMTAKQKTIYTEAEACVKKDWHKIKMSNNPLSMLLRMRQATGCPSILSEKATATDSAKLVRMKEIVEEITSSGGKVIVFSNWSSVTEEAKNILKDYRPAYITGDTTATDRMNEVDRFQNKDCNVIIGTIGAMGTGLTLNKANTVIFLDEPWNRALRDQAEDRAHRIGTQGTVNIITLMCKDTIDERIHDLVERKGAISDALVDGKISMEDINFLLS